MSRIIRGAYRESVRAALTLLRYIRPPEDGCWVANSLAWMENNLATNGGLKAHPRGMRGYPEVSGYSIPTLLAYQRVECASALTKWLLSVQLPDGSFQDLDGSEPFVFDTAQVLRGLLAASEIVPDASIAAERAARFISRRMIDGGRGGFPITYADIPESIHLYALPPLIQAAERFGEAEWRNQAIACAKFYLDQPYCLDVESRLTHFIGYEIDALIDLQYLERALSALAALRRRQLPSGAVAALGSCHWVCTPGLAQLAVCWAKLGEHDAAAAAVGWLRAHQRPSGGFWGSYGYRAQYAPLHELSWAAKFYLDAELLVQCRPRE